MTEVSVNSVVLEELSDLVLAIVDSFTDAVMAESTGFSKSAQLCFIQPQAWSHVAVGKQPIKFECAYHFFNHPLSSIFLFA
jgi:hypothetical protein